MRTIKRMLVLLAAVLVLTNLPAAPVFAADLPEKGMARTITDVAEPPAADAHSSTLEDPRSAVTEDAASADTPEHGEALISYLEEKRAGFPVGKPVAFMDEARIWDHLVGLTGNPYAAAGVMGNLSAESDLKTDNLQNCWEPILGYDDEGYTQAVDNDTYRNFVNDGAGYGLAQWTYHARKARLYTLAQEAGKSVSDMEIQLQLLTEELSSGSVLGKLRSAESAAEASDIVLTEFERPQEISDGLKQSRRNLSEYFYQRFALDWNPENTMTEAQRSVILAAAKYDGMDTSESLTGQQWVEHILTAAGFPVDSSCCAYHAAEAYRISDNWREVPPGAVVYGYAGGEYGHVGIYVGGGLVCHCNGGVAVDTLADWIAVYQGYCWGWEAGIDLTK